MPAGRGAEGRFDSGVLRQRLVALLGESRRWQLCVAFSGGRDSTALLHAAAALRSRGGPVLRAVHVDHHLQEASAAFRAHCIRMAASLRVPLSVLDVEDAPAPGVSVEAFAREARYRLFAGFLRDGESLLTAQHAQDQLETVLLQLLRGAGPAGLAAMPAQAPLGAGQLLRPLLAIDADGLAVYAAANGLRFIADPTNDDLRFDRNYLRARVLPALRERWPGAARSVARSARHAAEADRLVRLQAGRDLAVALCGEALQLCILRRFGLARQRAMLRLWCEWRGAPLPDERRLTSLLRAADARADAHPVVEWSGWRLRRVAGCFALEPLPGEQAPVDTRIEWSWRRRPRLALPGGGELCLERTPEGDLDLACLPPRLTIATRVGGERLVEDFGRRSVKKLLQERRVPAWLRPRVPLVWGEIEGRPALLAVADLAVAATVRGDATNRRGRGRFVWRPEG